MSTLPVLFDELPAREGGRIGVATLNAPRTLNSLSLEMIQALYTKLEAWAADRSIACVWLEGAGGKAFCAGGDIVSLYRAMTEYSGGESAFAETYFTAEYQLDHLIHCYPKPLIVWGDGIVMGGGLGLMAGGGQRVATENTRLAMPEISIGLYPDVGASWFLSRMPTGIGLYLGLTGAQFNGRDAVMLGLADRLIPRERRNAVLGALEEADLRYPDAGVRQVLAQFEARESMPEGQVMPRIDTLQALTDAGDVVAVVKRILDDTRDDAWLMANRERLAAGCPTTAHLVWRMQKRHRHGRLACALRDELNLSVQCCRHTELAEGVRALLIDKDRNPQWAYPNVASVASSYIDGFFLPLWTSDEHPLEAL
ncbi:enoyl-CoA hydratase/isomerase family protein [Halomonas sp. WWR20]